ncbi:MAG TPA: cupredoxin domain-containing protein [Dehalococcoidia bacterium]|nr:cupredoxin domain-containing protein [Dehalococcoidia bacterium]
MNTNKQVNIMIGFLILLVVTFGFYFVWDQNVRSTAATDKQVEENGERGGKIFAVNCRICHGPNGLGSSENVNFPGLPLNVDTNRPTEDGKLTPLRQRLTDTIRCGRVGTLMPPWSQAQGGPLTNTQIDQLVTLITGSGSSGVSFDPERVSQLGWDEAHVIESEQDRLPLQGPPLLLTFSVIASERTLIVNNPNIGITPDQYLRLEDEIVKVVEVRADRNMIIVDRGAFDTQPAPHAADTQIFNGPLPPPTGPLTGESGIPPCGQNAPAPGEGGGPTPSAGQPARPSAAQGVQAAATQPNAAGILATSAKDNFFTLNNLVVKVGAAVTLRLTNEGAAPHNLRIAGPDGKYGTADDIVVPVGGAFLSPGQAADVSLTLNQAGNYSFRCDVHPANMFGVITAQ